MPSGCLSGSAPFERSSMLARSHHIAHSGLDSVIICRSGSIRTGVRRLQAYSSKDDAVPEPVNLVPETITFFTQEGIVRIPGRMVEVPRRDKKQLQPMPSWQEQGICIGQTFEVAAWNARDPNRRVSFLGFCQSVDLLHESVEETVMSRGGEILEEERQLKSGISEQLRLTVVIPYLFGVPPQEEVLSAAIQQGGGIVDKVYKQWGMFPGIYPGLYSIGNSSSHRSGSYC